MVNISIILVCILSAVMFWVGFFMHWLITPKIGFIHIESNTDEEYDKFMIEFNRDPSELYSLHEVMLKVKYRAVSKENSLPDETT